MRRRRDPYSWSVVRLPERDLAEALLALAVFAMMPAALQLFAEGFHHSGSSETATPPGLPPVTPSRSSRARGGGGCGSELVARGLANVLKVLSPRWFVLRNVHQRLTTVLLQLRTTLCWLRDRRRGGI